MELNIAATEVEKVKKGIESGKKLTKEEWRVFVKEGEVREVLALLVKELITG
jgi:hypothetical protein